MENNQPPVSGSDNQESMEIAAFVLGICSLLVSLSAYAGIGFVLKLMLGLTAAVVGLILGIKSNKVRKSKMGTTAIVTSIISICIYLISVFACSACALIGCTYLGALM